MTGIKDNSHPKVNYFTTCSDHVPLWVLKKLTFTMEINILNNSLESIIKQ